MMTRLGVPVAAGGGRRRGDSWVWSSFFPSLCLLLLLPCLVTSCCSADASSILLPGIPLPDHLGFNSVTSSDSGCQHHHTYLQQRSQSGAGAGAAAPHHPSSSSSAPLKVQLKHRWYAQEGRRSGKETVVESRGRDLGRMRTLQQRRNNLNLMLLQQKTETEGKRKSKSKSRGRSMLEWEGEEEEGSMMVTATLESGVSQGSGEYFMDVFVGTPPRHFSLILDTGSDLNWIQCLPCHDCFPQHGPHYDPALSSTYRNLSCADPRCALVDSAPDNHLRSRSCPSPHHPCPYFYWYGDLSNTTGDLALEAFTLNTSSSSSSTPPVHNLVFGCGHWNRGLFHGAAGLLGLGRGPLSFTSQLRSLYGHPAFSYCLVDRNSNASVTSKLVLGQDPHLMAQAHPLLNFTSFVHLHHNPSAADTFYYLAIKAILVGGEALRIPPDTWDISAAAASSSNNDNNNINSSSSNGGGTIIDSGTTLSYFAEPAYGMIKEAFLRKMGQKHPRVEGFPVLDPCFNVSGVADGAVDVPEFAILFQDGAMWNFPPENYFIRLEAEEVICLAMLGTPRSSLSILGNYQQQNFHILYDTHASRLGFAPMNCALL